MKRFASLALACAVAMTTLPAPMVFAQVPTPAAASVVASALPQPPMIAAKAYILLDVTSGQVLASANPDMQVEPASLTKLMTAYLVFDALRAKRLSLDQTLTISPAAWKTPGSRMFVQPNTQVKVEDLIKGMIVQSGNDATVALAEGVGGTVDHFVQMMNAQAQALGMKHSAFKNPDGLPMPGHLTTARDLSILATALLRTFPDEFKYYSIKEFRYNNITQPNRNRLLFVDPSVDGFKTGHTDAAGFCLVATSAREFPNLKVKRRLLSVMLGASSDGARTAESQKLLNWGYQAWDDVELYGANSPVVTPRVWKGDVNEARLGSFSPIVVSVPRGMADKVKTAVNRPDPLIAPLSRGQHVGELQVSLALPSGTVPVSRQPLTVLAPVAPAGFFGRAWDAMRLWIQ